MLTEGKHLNAEQCDSEEMFRFAQHDRFPRLCRVTQLEGRQRVLVRLANRRREGLAVGAVLIIGLARSIG